MTARRSPSAGWYAFPAVVALLAVVVSGGWLGSIWGTALRQIHSMTAGVPFQVDLRAGDTRDVYQAFQPGTWYQDNGTGAVGMGPTQAVALGVPTQTVRVRCNAFAMDGQSAPVVTALSVTTSTTVDSRSWRPIARIEATGDGRVQVVCAPRPIGTAQVDLAIGPSVIGVGGPGGMFVGSVISRSVLAATIGGLLLLVAAGLWLLVFLLRRRTPAAPEGPATTV